MLLILIFGITSIISLVAYVVQRSIKRNSGGGIREWLWHNSVCIEAPFIVSAIMFGIILFAAGINHISWASMPYKCEIAQQTLDKARSSTANLERNPLEDAAILQTVVELNQKLAGIKYWHANPWTSWFWPTKAANTPYIK